MTNRTLSQTFQRLTMSGPLTLVSRSIEIFGWIDLVLGLLILIAPRFTGAVFHLPRLSPLDAGLIRVVGVLVTTIGALYIINGRFNSLGFAVASLLDRPLVPLIMAVLWHKRILPGPLAASFSIVDFGGFLATAFAWRADLVRGRNIGGAAIPGQTRAARSVEVFGWLIIVIGSVTLLFPGFTASLLKITSGDFSPGAHPLSTTGRAVGRWAGHAVCRRQQPRQRRFCNRGCIGTMDRPAAHCTLMVDSGYSAGPGSRIDRHQPRRRVLDAMGHAC